MNNEITELKKQIEQLKNELKTLQKKVEQKTPIGFEDDPIFLLSKEEYEKYKNNIPKFSAWWWLRSSNEDFYYAAIVDTNGSVIDCDLLNEDRNLVRPALRISHLKCNTVLNYDSTGTRFFALGATWKIIDDEEDIAIAEMPLMSYQFDTESNNYEESEVRKKLLGWYKERIYW